MFTSIFNVMQENQALSLNLMRTGGKLVVCFQPLASNVSDAAGSNLTPLVITATPAELDDGFIAAISTPLKERFEMLVNMEEFRKSTQKSQPKANTKASGNVSVEAGTGTAPKKNKKDEQIEEAEKLAKLNNLPAAFAIYKKLYEQDKTDNKIGNKMHELWAQMSQKPLFPAETTVVADTKPEIQPAVPVDEQPPVVTNEEKEQEEDMFAQMLNPSKVEEPQIVRTEAVVNTVPPGVDPKEYQKFLDFQKFQESQGVMQAV